MCKSICKVDLQKHPQGTRFAVLTLIDGLMANQRDGMCGEPCG